MSTKRFWLIYIPACVVAILLFHALNTMGMNGLRPAVILLGLGAIYFSYNGRFPRVVETEFPATLTVEEELDKLRNRG